MIEDFSKAEQSDFEADVCIVGSGIASYALFTELVKTNLKIIVTERGPWNHEKGDPSFKKCEIAGHAFRGHQDGREFGLGGTAVTWGGQALPLSTSDFEKKDWIPESGWPITWDSLIPYYAVAEKLMKLDTHSYETDLFSLQKLPPLSIDTSKLKVHFSKWSPQPNLQMDVISLSRQHPNVKILLNAGCYEFISETAGEIQYIKIENPQRKQGRVRARYFVLASGGIENPRLLMMSSTLPQSEMLGKMFQDHPSAQAATIIPRDEKKLQDYFNYFFVGKTRFLPKVSLADSYLKKERLLAATSFVQFISPENSLLESARDIYRNIKRFKGPTGKQIRSFFKNINEIGTLIQSGMSYVKNKRVYTPRSKARITILVEQEPDRSRLISLSDEKDSNGHPIAKIKWEISDDSVKSFLAMCSLWNEEFAKLDLGVIEWEPWVTSDFSTIKMHLTDSLHHAGATRMSTSIVNGVVDKDCCLHGTNNLFIAGSSVFPTSGHSNPTLTLMALAVRLGQHIAQTDMLQRGSND